MRTPAVYAKGRAHTYNNNMDLIQAQKAEKIRARSFKRNDGRLSDKEYVQAMKAAEARRKATRNRFKATNAGIEIDHDI